MAKQSDFRVGPVLSFRGMDQGQGKTDWRVSVMIAIDKGKAPVLTLGGEAQSSPTELLAWDDFQVLRYECTIALGAKERRVEYSFSGAPEKWSFSVPSESMVLRMAYVSCNGFSDPDGLRKLIRPVNNVWEDLLSNHDRRLRPQGYLLDKEQLWHEERVHESNLQRFHVLLMGGDQIYFDSIWHDIPELEEWIQLSRDEQLNFKVSQKLEDKIEDYYYSLYCDRWLPPKGGKSGSQKVRRLSGADAMAHCPTVMMWDDHDIFDGWGSYTSEMQSSQLFQVLFKHARKAFWVFQLQHAIGTLPFLQSTKWTNVKITDPQFKPVDWPKVLSGDKFALPLLPNQPGFSYGFRLGPVSLIAADLRTERSRTQILSEPTWDAINGWAEQLPNGQEEADPLVKCHHLMFMSSVPVAHPKLTLAENALDVLGEDHVLDSNADDLNDHWSHDRHEGERKRLIRNLMGICNGKALRTTILSGDVHVAAWGTISRKDATPATNWRRLQQLTSSAVVHPSLSGVLERIFLGWLNRAAATPQPIDSEHDIQVMLFPGHNKHVHAARNWLALEIDPEFAEKKSPRLWATWRCETKDGFSNHLLAIHAAAAEKGDG